MSKHFDYVAFNQATMKKVWDKIPKIKLDGKDYIKYIRDDISYLYQSGMIDIERVSFQEFEDFFLPLKKVNDACFYLTQDDFIRMGQFRYCKIVGKPFDPEKMRKGKYSAERLWRLFENSIIPSTNLPRHFIEEQFNNLANKTDADGMVLVNENVIDHIRYALNNHPSPKRRLELDVARLQEYKIEQAIAEGHPSTESTFTQDNDIKGSTVKDLNQVLLQTHHQAEDPHRKPSGEEFNLKSFTLPKLKKV